MDTKEIRYRLGYVRNQANLSASELSGRIGMSKQYVAQLESGRIVLTVEKLLMILDVCNFPIDRFFSENITEYNENQELLRLICDLPLSKKQNMIEFLRK